MNFSHVFCILVVLGLHETHYGVKADKLSKDQLEGVTNILKPLFTTIAQKIGANTIEWFKGLNVGCTAKDLRVMIMGRVTYLTTQNKAPINVDAVIDEAITNINNKGYDFTASIVETLQHLKSGLKDHKQINFSELALTLYGWKRGDIEYTDLN